MKLQDHYDWIVIGNHPAALLSASLVARLGLAVLILPLSPSLGLSVSRSGQYFDPESNYLLGLGQFGKSMGLVSACFNKIGLLPAEQSLINIEHSTSQVLTPDLRLALTHHESLQFELQREFGKAFTKQLGLVNALRQSEGEYITFWQNLPHRLTLNSNRKPSAVEAMTLHQLQKRLSKGSTSSDSALGTWISPSKRISDLAQQLKEPSLTEVGAGLWYGITQTINPNPSLFDLLHALSISRTGASFKGGMTAYRGLLLELAKRHGAHIPPKTECRRIFVENGSFVGVQITNKGNMISCGGGVLGATLDKAAQKIIYSGRNWIRRVKKSPRPTGWKFTIALTVHQEAIPVGLLSRAIWQEKEAPLLELEVANPADYSGTQAGHRVLYLRTWMPFQQESLKLDYQRLIAGRMLRQAVEILPFLEFHVTQIFPDFRSLGARGIHFGVLGDKSEGGDGASSRDLIEVYGFNSLEAIPENLLIYQGKGVGSASGIDRLFLASDECYPELGSLGPTVAALESVAWQAHRSGLAGPFA